MADALASADLVVQQMLHGYGDGHRLLATSASPPAQDARTMLVLSDVSGSGAKLPAGGYLTGYPLSTWGKFVLARTWAAPEMTRPGCVWTHSLLIDFADLARLRTGADLISLFRRPEGRSRRVYDTPVRVRMSPATQLDAVADASAGKALLGSLYGSPRQKVVAPYGGEHDERLILALWMQQWPRLRRGFRFCSFSAADRSTNSEVFDLQLVDRNDLSHRSRVPNTMIASAGQFEPGLKPLLIDLLMPDREGLRSFLRDVGGEVSSGRGAMLPLIRLFTALRSDSAAQLDLATAFAVMEELGPSQARGARTLVVERALDQVEDLDDQVFQLVMEHVTSDEKLLSDPVANRLGRALWSRSPAMFADALDHGGVLARAADLGIQSLGREELVEGLAAAPGAAIAVTKRRRDLLADASFWRLPGIEVDRVLAAATVDGDALGSVIGAIIIGGRGDAANVVARRFGGARLIDAIEIAATDVPPDHLVPWLNALQEHSTDLAVALVGGVIRQRALLVALARAIDPDFVPNESGDDPWVLAVERSSGSLNAEAEDYLAAFLLARGLGRRSRAPERLIALSVQRVHTALATSGMPSTGWQLIYRRLPWVLPWVEWDRCGRVRQAVVDRFVDFDLDPGQFGVMSEDVALWRDLVDLAASTGRGRRYLDRVRRQLNDASDEERKERTCYIERRVGKRR